MKIIDIKDIKGTDREVRCPNGDFISNRFLLEADGFGFTLTKTEVPKGVKAIWHYKNHLEACYCLSGWGVVKKVGDDIGYSIIPDMVYALNDHDEHEFTALEDTELLCVFNPPLKGKETHRKDGSYE